MPRRRQLRLHCVDPRRGLNALRTEPISRASADQRAGRAGRTAPGTCVRLWSEVDHARRPAAETPEVRRIDLAGVFGQIGLVPNTEFLKGVVELSRFGEIQVDERCATSVPGIFAAGDATTVPYKQIVIAAGEGAKAALGAFDHLIRQSPSP